MKVTLHHGKGDMQYSTVIGVPGPSFSLGRSSSCDYVCGAGSVSRRHAEITVTGACVTISDCGSTNGTTVNGKKVTESTSLKNGDVILLGAERFDVVISEDKKPDCE